MMSIPTFTTPRLVLRPFTLGDVDPLASIFDEPDVLRYFPNPKPPARQWVEKFINNQLTHWNERGFGWWAVEYRAAEPPALATDGSAPLIGWNGLQYLPETDEIEIGYLLAKPYWGLGLATEGARVGLKFGFEDLGLEQIIGVVHPDNAASIRVLEKIGLSFVERTEYFGMQVCRYIIPR